MSSYPETRESLIASLSDQADRESWEQFAATYRPVIYRLARSRGVQDADAQDIAQQVLVSVANAIGQWEKREPEIRFRHWLHRVARNAIINSLSRQPRDRPVGGTTAGDLLHEQPHQTDVTPKEIKLEYRRQLYLHAAEKVKGEIDIATWQAFEMSTVQGISIESTAKEIGCLLYTSPSPRDATLSRMPSSA